MLSRVRQTSILDTNGIINARQGACTAGALYPRYGDMRRNYLGSASQKAGEREFWDSSVLEGGQLYCQPHGSVGSWHLQIASLLLLLSLLSVSRRYGMVRSDSNTVILSVQCSCLFQFHLPATLPRACPPRLVVHGLGRHPFTMDAPRVLNQARPCLCSYLPHLPHLQLLDYLSYNLNPNLYLSSSTSCQRTNCTSSSHDTSPLVSRSGAKRIGSASKWFANRGQHQPNFPKHQNEAPALSSAILLS